VLLGEIERACGKYWNSLSTRQQAHCFLSHLISGCLPVFDELCRRSMSFVRSCLSQDFYLIRFVANYAEVHARSQSFLGHNCFWAHRCQFSVNICNRLSSFDNLVKSFMYYSIDDNMRCSANLLYDLIMIRERKTILKWQCTANWRRKWYY